MEQQTSDLFDLQVDQQSHIYLSETARWSRFLSIVGFVMCALIVLVAIFAGSIFSSFGSMFGGAMGAMGGASLTIIYLLIAVLYFFPCLYLYRFSSNMKIALASHDQTLLNTSFKNLKSCFRYLGILTIIFLSLYALGILVAIIGVASR